MKKFAVLIFAMWCILLGTIHFILCWVFVAITAIIDILTVGFNFKFTQHVAGEMTPLQDFVEDLKCCIKRVREIIK